MNIQILLYNSEKAQKETFHMRKVFNNECYKDPSEVDVVLLHAPFYAIILKFLWELIVQAEFLANG